MSIDRAEVMRIEWTLLCFGASNKPGAGDPHDETGIIRRKARSMTTLDIPERFHTQRAVCVATVVASSNVDGTARVRILVDE